MARPCSVLIIGLYSWVSVIGSVEPLKSANKGVTFKKLFFRKKNVARPTERKEKPV